MAISISQDPDTDPASAAPVRPRAPAAARTGDVIRLLEATLDRAGDGLLTVDRTGRVVHFNRAFATMWGMPPRTLPALVHPLEVVIARLRDPDALRRTLEQLRSEPDRPSSDVIVSGDGRRYEACSRPHRIGTAVVGRVWRFRDVTEAQETEQRLRVKAQETEQRLRAKVQEREQRLRAEAQETERRLRAEAQETERRLRAEAQETEQRLRAEAQYFRSLIENVPDTITILDATGRITYESLSVLRVLGYGPEELVGKSLFDCVHGDDRQAALRDFEALLGSPGAAHSLELRFLHKEGSWRTLEVIAKNLLEDAAIAGVVVHARDITQRKQAEAEAEAQLLLDAYHDRLTSLPNRALFLDRLTQAMKRVRGAHPSFAVLYSDLDRFELVNDRLGRAAGDRLLVSLARRLERCVRPGDTVARLDGDEFTILLEDITDLRAAEGVAERIRRELESPFDVEGHEARATASIGIALSAPGYSHAEELLRDAGVAMNRAKARGGAGHAVFDGAARAPALAAPRIEAELRHAIARGMLRLFFQPIFRLEDGRLAGFESLLCWRRPGKGVLTPDRFLQLAEETGLMAGIGWWVVQTAARAVRTWQTEGAEPLFVTVNLSPAQLAQPDLAERVAGILRGTQTPGDLLKIEISERVLMEQAEDAAATLQRLRRLGVGLCIDDFGTGYASLRDLHEIPVETIKLDPSLIGRLGVHGEGEHVVETILGLAQALGMDVIAEGIATKTQRGLLRDMGCAYGQGPLFSPPVPAGAVRRMIDERAGWRQAAVAGV